MSSVPSLVADPERLAALDALAVLDTPPEEGFDDVVHLAAQLCAAPVALVSLVDRDRQWFKARVGFPPAQTDLDRSVCKHVLAEPDVLVIPDLSTDPRTAENPIVTDEPRIRFYAGAPLRTPDGQVLGSLCVIDHKPRPRGLSLPQKEGLRRLARQVMRQLDLRQAVVARDALLADQRTFARERSVFGATQAAIAAAGGDFATVLDTLVAGAMDVVPAAEGAALELVDGDALEYRAVRGSLAPHRGLRVPLAGSTSGACFRTNAPILVADARRDERVDQALREAIDLGSAIHVPVTRGPAVLGVLKLQSSRVGAFTQRDLALAQLFAGAATAGLTEVAEAEAERARQRAQVRLDLLARVSAALLTADDPARAVEPILAAGAERLGFDQAYLHDLAPDGRHLRLAHAVGADEDARATLGHVGLDAPLYARVVETRRPLVLRGVLASTEAGHAAARALGIDAFAAYPVASRGRLVGTISFASTREPAFDAEALAFFETVARYLSAVRERLDGERALRESDARSRLAQEAGHVGTFEIDVDTGLMNVSPELCRVFGVPLSAVYSAARFEALVLPEDRSTASSEDTREAGTAALDVEYRIRRADDGAVRWIARRGTFARDEAGRVTRMLGTVQDVTETKRTLLLLQENEERLRASDERLQMALAASGVVGLWDWMVDTDLLHGDANFARLYGLDVARTAAGITMEQYQEFVVPEDVGPLRAAIGDTFERGADFLVEYRLAIPGRELRWVECKGRMIHDATGAPVRFSGTAVDVTARKQAEVDLRESREQLALERGLLTSVLDQAPVGISLAFADGRASFNARAVQMLGHEPGEGDARYAAHRAVHADGRPYAPEEYPTLRALRRGEVVQDEPMRHRGAAGEEVRRWAISSAPIRDAAGAIVAAVSLFSDVEDALRDHEALERSRERLDLAFAASGSLGWFDWDVPNDRLYAGEAFARLFAVDPAAAAAGAPLADFVEGLHPDDREWVGALIERTLAVGGPYEAEYRLRHPDGRVYWAYARGHCFLDADGRPARFPGVAADITERKEAEAEARRLAAIVEQSGDFIGVAHLDGGVAWVNEAGRRLVGLSDAESARATKIEDYFDPELWPEIVATVFPAVDRDGHWAGELRFRHFVTGALIPVIYDVIAPRDAGGAVAAYATVTRDITEQKRAEGQREILARELAHRLKNTLAMVQAIVTQTLRNTADVAEARAVLAARLVALGKAHDILMTGEGRQADMRTVVADALAIHDDGRPGRFRIEGPTMMCGARAGLSLALMMHELATNAAKYGALSTAEGEVSVTWELSGSGDDETLMLTWRERGGPPVVPPTRKGFGSKLIERGLAGAVGGETRTTYASEGVTCTVTAPAAGFEEA